MKKVRIILLVILSSSAILNAQSLKDAIKLTDNEQFNNAAVVFKKLIAAEPTNGENYFYFGENYFKSDNIDSARIMYQKGADMNATNGINYVGLGKVQWYQKNDKDAKANFYKATTLSQNKNATILMKIAEAYINSEIKNIPEAVNLLSQAAKLEPNNIDIYILLGDAYLNQANGTEAMKYYNKAGDMDKKSVKAILRKGQLYGQSKNYTLALDYYKEANSIDSMYAPAYREKAELYGLAGQYPKASTQYKRFLELNNDYSARIRYVPFLFLSKQYQPAIDEINRIQKKDTNTVSLYRILGYADYETGKYPEGLIALNKFFAKAEKTKARILPLDYEYLGKLLGKNNQDSVGVMTLTQALKLDSTKVDLYGELGSMYLKMKKYQDAVNAYTKKEAKGKANANDFYGAGRSYYFMKDFVNADSAFVKITRSNPDLPLGYLWRAKANAQQDPKNEKWLAKSYYEMFISKVKPEDTEKNKKDLVDANTYLGVYYLNHKDYHTAKTYFQKVIELDPANTNAKKFLASPEAK